MHDNEQVASPRIVLLFSAWARYRFGNHMNIMITSVVAAIISDGVDVSGSM